MIRAILNFEASLEDVTSDDGPREHRIVLAVNGHKFYSFPTDEGYWLEYQGGDIAVVVASHFVQIVEKGKQ